MWFYLWKGIQRNNKPKVNTGYDEVQKVKTIENNELQPRKQWRYSVLSRLHKERERKKPNKNNSKLVMLNLVQKHQVVFTQAYSNHNFQGMATMGVVKFSLKNI